MLGLVSLPGVKARFELSGVDSMELDMVAELGSDLALGDRFPRTDLVMTEKLDP